MRALALVVLTAACTWSRPAPPPGPPVPTSTATSASDAGARVVRIDPRAVHVDGNEVLRLAPDGLLPAHEVQGARVTAVSEALAAGTGPVEVSADPSVASGVVLAVLNTVFERVGSLPDLRVRDSKGVPRAIDLSAPPVGESPKVTVRAWANQGFVVLHRDRVGNQEELRLPCRINRCPTMDSWDRPGLRDAARRLTPEDGLAGVRADPEVPWQITVDALDAVRDGGARWLVLGIGQVAQAPLPDEDDEGAGSAAGG